MTDFKRWDLVRYKARDFMNYLGSYARVVNFNSTTRAWAPNGHASIQYGQQSPRYSSAGNMELVGHLEPYKIEYGLPNVGDYVYLVGSDMGMVIQTQGTKARILWNNARTRYEQWIESSEIKRLARLSNNPPRSAFEF